MAGANYPLPEKTSLPGRWPANLVLQGDAVGMTGGASRFFYNVNENLDAADPLYYCGKISASERDAGLAGFEEKPAGAMQGRRENSFADDLQVTARNHHPTCKPIDLIRHLSALLLPPKEYTPRKILVPFSGSGSEMIGCHIAGWDEITGIERETEYIEIARARLEHWTAQADLF